MAALIGLLMTPWGRMVGAAFGLFLMVASWRAYDLNKQRGIGAERERAKMERAADANASKAEKARQSVQKIPDDRLHDRYRRD